MLPFRLANVVEIYRKLMDYVQLIKIANQVCWFVL